MRKAIIFLGILVFTIGNFSFAQPANASLVLGADPSIYIGADADPWFTDSWLTGPSSNFNLTLSNQFTNNNIKDIYLVIALKESTKSGLSIIIDGGTPLVGSNFSQHGTSGPPPVPHPYMQDAHGVYGVDTYFYDFYIGDLAKDTSRTLAMSVVTSGSPIVHFDAYGWKVKNNDDLQLINNPNSSDVTWDPPEYNERNPPVPEPTTLSLLGLGLLGILRFRKLKKKL